MSRKPRILVVDDEVDICENLRDILTDLDYDVETTTSGFKALQLVQKIPFDIALLDLKMPEMDGVTLYRGIKEIRADTVAIIVTAYATDQVAEEAMGAGAWRILSKPVEFPQLLGLVEEALEQPLIMVVDDDHDLCTSLWEVLRERGYRVATAHDITSAREKLAAKNYRVVLLDMKLPEGDGRELYRLVRELCPDARTVVITGYRSDLEESVDQVLADGADDVCYKPFDVRALLEKIQKLSAGR